ncbi:hypothetical protein JHFBIEKO_2259 [Methylobacterium mesophilicum]|nr:hypothetical protein JHFBIEKO_2259 [Methylobacterium mesophilicum]
MPSNYTSQVAEDRFLTKSAVKRRYDDCSDMWIHRRLKDKSGFPKPIYISRRPFWSLEELAQWERSLAFKKAA